MKLIRLFVVLALTAAITPIFGGAHPKLLGAARTNKAVIIENGKVIKEYPTPQLSHDAWANKDGSVIACGKGGVVKYKADGTKIFSFTPPKEPGLKAEVHTCMPLANEHTLVAVNGAVGKGKKAQIHAFFYELDASGKTVKKYPIAGLTSTNAHLQIRCVRRRNNGEYLITAAAEDKIIILKPDATVKRIIDLKKILPKGLKTKKVHGIAALNNGNMLIGLGYGSVVVELDTDDKVVWQLTPADVPEVGMKYAAGVQRLPNGNTVITASKSKYTIFEVTPDKKVLWKISADLCGPISAVQILSVPYDPAKFDSQK